MFSLRRRSLAVQVFYFGFSEDQVHVCFNSPELGQDILDFFDGAHTPRLFEKAVQQVLFRRDVLGIRVALSALYEQRHDELLVS